MKPLALILFLLFPFFLSAQAPNAAYVKALYQKYPTQKSDLCPACKLWVNPYYKAIADTQKHAPLLTYYVYTRAHRLEQESADVPRIGIYASWHPAFGQPDETTVYREANRVIGKPNSAEMIAKGHCQAWILLAWCADAAILSDTYTFNAGMEFQGQNVGTEIATEELCRKLTGYKGEALTDSVKIWCGTYGSLRTYTEKGLTITVPSHYYKVIAYHDQQTGNEILLTYWMPNDPAEKKNRLKDRMITYAELVARIGFDPRNIFN
ncbi:MAG TPA: hypothetical protein ENO28_16665 [Bacteroidetes bacterium]|nr:hypothetical protein [Bacteroidota bacterium]